MFYGQLFSNLFPLLIRIVFRWQAFRQSKKAIALYCLSLALSQFLHQYLKRMGTPRRDSTGNLVSSGDDLNHPGMTEWIFDILYVACKSEDTSIILALITSSFAGFAQVGSAIFGEWLWWIYAAVLFPLISCAGSYMIRCPSDSYVCDLQTMEHTHLAHSTRPFVFCSRGRAEAGRVEQAAGKNEEA